MGAAARLVAGALVFAFALAPPAWAGTGSLRLEARDGGLVLSPVYAAAPGERNEVSVFFDWSQDGTSLEGIEPSPPRPPTAVIVNDGNLENPGPGCARGPAGNSDSLRCPIPPGARVLAGLIEVGDGDDQVQVTVRGATVLAGRGDDTISGERGRFGGGPGDDYIAAGGRILGGDGDDDIRGSDGDDMIVAGPGLDVVSSGRGDDVVRTRDGQIDAPVCGDGRDTVFADGLDIPGLEFGSFANDCERVRRRGNARAIPIAATVYGGCCEVEVLVACPWDGPPRCVGQVWIRVGRRVLGPEAVRPRRGSLGTAYFVVGRGSLGRLEQRGVPTRVRTRDRQGKHRIANALVGLSIERPSD